MGRPPKREGQCKTRNLMKYEITAFPQSWESGGPYWPLFWKGKVSVECQNSVVSSSKGFEESMGYHPIPDISLGPTKATSLSSRWCPCFRRHACGSPFLCPQGVPHQALQYGAINKLRVTFLIMIGHASLLNLLIQQESRCKIPLCVSSQKTLWLSGNIN